MPLLHIGAGGPSELDWVLQLDVLALCVLLEGAYLYAVTKLRPRLSDAGRVKRSQVMLFSLGVLTIYVATGSPIHVLADTYWASAHMVQHVLLMLVAAPLLLAGAPGWLWQALLRSLGLMPAMRVLTRPLVAIVVFNAVLLLTHLPSAIDMQLDRWGFHLFVHAVQLVAGVLMWWPVLSAVPELPRASYPVQMGYLFVQSLLPAVMASFITFADSAVYSYYAEAPRLWGVSAITDQQIAGGLMKLLGTLILWSVMTAVFFRWYAREQEEEREPRWDDVRAELDELGLARK